MLVEITIENFAIIDKISLQFDEGLNVLTGETGAGKSIIIDAVQVVLGGRASPDMVRSGASRAYVEALFDVVPDNVRDKMEEWGFEPLPELVLSREIQSNGRSVARVNGRLATAAMLKQIGRGLVDIHGQGEHQLLLDQSRHIDLLDLYGAENVLVQRDRFGTLYARYAALGREIEKLSDSRERARRIDLLQFQVEEIERAGLREGEEQELKEERRVLGSAHRLVQTAQAAYELVYAGGHEGLSSYEATGRAHSMLHDLEAIDPELVPVSQSLEQAYVWLEEASMALRKYLGQRKPDPERLHLVEQRLSLLQDLKRKYGDGIEQILLHKEQALSELDALEHADEHALKLESERAEVLAQMQNTAKELSDTRTHLAEVIAEQVVAELFELGMKGTRFEVEISQEKAADGIALGGTHVRATAKGVDEVQFMLSPNPGEPLKPLSKIASGGEASRIMLALKCVLARAEGMPTLIFDEVDAGVGGETAFSLAQKLYRLGSHAQVLCVTHLAQIAAFADAHIVLTKKSESGRTFTEAVWLKADARASEMARMMGGKSAASIQHANEMLRNAKKLRRE